jgi:hypothetical protein
MRRFPWAWPSKPAEGQEEAAAQSRHHQDDDRRCHPAPRRNLIRILIGGGGARTAVSGGRLLALACLVLRVPHDDALLPLILQVLLHLGLELLHVAVNTLLLLPRRTRQRIVRMSSWHRIPLR